MKKYIAEFIGTFVLTFMGCGAAVFTGNLLAIAVAFGLSIVAMAYSIGNISGCHVNPAVSFAMFLTKKLSKDDLVGYVIAQVVGAICGGAVLKLITTLRDGKATKVIGANGFDEYSGIGLNAGGALIVEVILTCIFVYVILGVTSKVEFANIAGIVIGLTLTFVHIVGINLTGTSVNPARSIGAALFSGSDALAQVWVFIVAPLAGAAAAAYLFMYLHSDQQ
ncbi:MAG: aquaporin [Eubacterium sp.]|nr:aquaporin [Eubacterium sp.]